MVVLKDPFRKVGAIIKMFELIDTLVRNSFFF
jgi:hypothetical protein